MIFLKTALSSAAIAMFIGTASFAQGGNPLPGERVDAQGMPTTRSTPAEQAETARINKQVGVSNAAVDARAAAGDAQYQAQQQQYQGQLQQNRRSSRTIRTAPRPMPACRDAMPPSAPPIIAACGRIVIQSG